MKTILIAQFKHETNSFSDCLTNMDSYHARNCLFGEEIIAYFQNVKNEMGGFLDVLRDCEDIRAIPVLALDAMPSGPVTMDVFNMVKAKILRAIAQYPQLHGVLLSLHGAMVLTCSEDGDGDLIEAIRSAVGETVPVIASLDLHANITEKMLSCATALVATKEYPHTDMYEAGLRAAILMRDTLRAKIAPVMRCKKLPLLMPYMPTDAPMMQKLRAKAEEYVRRGLVLEADICHGFFPADITQMGAGMIAVANGSAEAAEQVAGALMQALWDDRHALKRDYVTISQAIDMLRGMDKKPVVLADVTDNPGAGSPGDSTHIIRALLEQGITSAAVATMYDPETARQAVLTGVGGTLRVSLGGKQRPELCGAPVKADAIVLCITNGQYRNRDEMGHGMLVNMGQTVVLQIKNVKVIVASERIQPWDAEVFRSCAIAPEEQNVLVVKSTLHYKKSFGKLGGALLDVEVPGVAPQSPQALVYRRCRRPVYPLDDI